MFLFLWVPDTSCPKPRNYQEKDSYKKSPQQVELSSSEMENMERKEQVK